MRFRSMYEYVCTKYVCLFVLWYPRILVKCNSIYLVTMKKTFNVIFEACMYVVLHLVRIGSSVAQQQVGYLRLERSMRQRRLRESLPRRKRSRGDPPPPTKQQARYSYETVPPQTDPDGRCHGLESLPLLCRLVVSPFVFVLRDRRPSSASKQQPGPRVSGGGSSKTLPGTPGDDSQLSPTWEKNENAPFWRGFQWNIWMP